MALYRKRYLGENSSLTNFMKKFINFFIALKLFDTRGLW